MLLMRSFFAAYSVQNALLHACSVKDRIRHSLDGMRSFAPRDDGPIHSPLVLELVRACSGAPPGPDAVRRSVHHQLPGAAVGPAVRHYYHELPYRRFLVLYLTRGPSPQPECARRRSLRPVTSRASSTRPQFCEHAATAVLPSGKSLGPGEGGRSNPHVLWRPGACFGTPDPESVPSRPNSR